MPFIIYKFSPPVKQQIHDVPSFPQKEKRKREKRRLRLYKGLFFTARLGWSPHPHRSYRQYPVFVPRCFHTKRSAAYYPSLKMLIHIILCRQKDFIPTKTLRLKRSVFCLYAAFNTATGICGLFKNRNMPVLLPSPRETSISVPFSV